MARVDLTPEEARMLRDVLESYLSDLRMEIAGTESVSFRENLKNSSSVRSSTPIGVSWAS